MADTLELRPTARADRGLVITRRAAGVLAETVTHELECKLHDGDAFTGEVVSVGSAVTPGTLLVGKRRGERTVSLRCPPDARGVVTDVRAGETSIVVVVREERPVVVGDVLGLDDGTVDVVAEIVDDLGGADLVWPGVTGSRAVHRVAAAVVTQHARSIGPYSLVTQQPLAGKAQFGGQRVSADELDALEARGASWTAFEMITVKSDDVPGRMKLYETIVRGQPACVRIAPRATDVLECELRALGFDVAFAGEEVGIRLLDDDAIREAMPGVVKKPETIHYRTFKPERGGLFCEEIFGDLASGKRHLTFGRLDLPVPVLHPWLLEPTALLLDRTPREVQEVVSCERTLAGEIAETFDATGPTALRGALAELDVVELAGRDGARGELARQLLDSHQSPAQFCFQRWPVLPPDLRPLVPLDGGRFATSDLNDLYRRAINRSNRLHRLRELTAPDVILINEMRELQAAIDAVVQNGLRGNKITSEGRPLVSLADMLSGPKGRFATNLLGKRVDYSAVAHVVPVPGLAPDRVRVSRSVARELFMPWVYCALEAAGHVTTIKVAKRLVETHDPRAEAALDAIATGYPVVMFPLEAAAPARLASLDVEIWDAPAFGLAPSTIEALGVARGAAAVIHVPVDPRAKQEVRELRTANIHEPLTAEPGWLARASAASDVGPVLVAAALRGEVDPIADPRTRRILGRRVG